MRISDWSAEVCSSDLIGPHAFPDRGDDLGHDAHAVFQAAAITIAALVVEFGREALQAAAGVDGKLEAVGTGLFGVSCCYGMRFDQFLDLVDGHRTRLCIGKHRSEEHTSELQSLMRISSA